MTYVINHNAEALLLQTPTHHPDFDRSSCLAFYVAVNDLPRIVTASRAYIEDHSRSDDNGNVYVQCYTCLIVREIKSQKWLFVVINSDCDEDDDDDLKNYYEQIAGPYDSYEDALTSVSLTIPYYKSNFSIL